MTVKQNSTWRLSTFAVTVLFGAGLLLIPAGLDFQNAEAGVQSKVKRLVNKERKKRKRPRLKTNGALRKAAQKYSRLQKRMGKTGHEIDGTTPTERAVAAGFNGTLTGEAIANAPTAELAVGFWKMSNSHRKIMLNRKAKVAGFGKAGRIWTAKFGNKTPPPVVP